MKIFINILFLFPLIMVAQTPLEEGEQFFEEKNWEAAEEKFQQINKGSRHYLKAQEYIADIAAQQKEWDDALAIYKMLLEKDPDNANYNFKYGGTLGLKSLEVNKLKAAMYISDIKKYLKKAAALDEHHTQSRWVLVELYLQLPGMIGGSQEVSEKYANELFQIDATNGYFAKAHIEAYAENFDSANAYNKKALHSIAETCSQTLKKLPVENSVEEKSNKVNCPEYERNSLHYQVAKTAANENIKNEMGVYYLQLYLKNYSELNSIPLEEAYLVMARLHKNLSNKTEAKRWIEKAIAQNRDFKEAKKEKTLIEAM